MLQWSLYVEPEDGWGVGWKGGLCAMVVIISIIVSLLIFLLLVSRCAGQRRADRMAA
jgi:hypothetical protein